MNSPKGHNDKVMSLCTISADSAIGPYFLEDNNGAIRSDRQGNKLRSVFKPNLGSGVLKWPARFSDLNHSDFFL